MFDPAHQVPSMKSLL